MARVSRVVAHQSVEEVKQKLAETKYAWQQKWLIIYNAMVDPREAQEIALHTGTSVWTVHKVISKYNRYGAAAIETVGKGGRRNCYLSWQQEQEFLAPFFEQASLGEITTVAVIQKSFEERIGEVVDAATIYRLLQRHGWRKLVPRPHHPKGDLSEQEEFKKTSSHESKRCWQPVLTAIPDQC
ncbi:winged helix-turn-helix domain-containing protein [Gloeocapsopsis crepidinum LEGE 06123]|uniref:Winged helix-turn-helix domain-containing protein n=1 Tax=Gloeocapsopsis crepidinum LEGE 06123 TaxID=588587 RepID=A0ABR9UZJ7_9CHRO|nr:winged helix-turn-helix domain-containing protein [Gloeocapsopsis crepidinum]MBE9193737.1 winged helix-turn-helix domain-containing protein [Gloeocapsopsis crepidinum LEGE 06123]